MEVHGSEEELETFHVRRAQREGAESVSQTILADALEGVANAWRERETIELETNGVVRV